MTMKSHTFGETVLFGILSIWANAALAQVTKPAPLEQLPIPQVGAFVQPGHGAASYQSIGNTGTITQTSDRVVLNWQSFDIGKGNSVVFNQPGANSAALNLIHAGRPSEIQGALKANGQIYLINKNGIMFMNGAQVNVGSLIASTLNITPDRFNSSILTANPGDGALSAAFAKDGVAGSVTVDQGALITADKNGRIILLGSNVTNSGILQTNNGQVLIAAGDKVYLAASDDPSLRGLLVEVDVERQPANEDGTIPKPLNGNVTNIGNIIAERGNATLAGLTVNQRGKISATTAVNANGSIRLLARDTAIKDPNIGSDGFKLAASVGGSVEIGKGSVTEVLPDLNDTSTIDGSGLFQRSKVEIFGKTIKHEGVIKAPNGEVTLTARLNPTSIDPASSEDAVKLRNGSLVYLAEGSAIDVSGTSTTLLPMSRNQLEVELRGDELKDFPLQRQGILRGSKVNIEISRGLQLADVSKQIAAVKQGIGELTSEGGNVKVLSEGDVVMKRGSTIDVSGGKIAYEAGFITTTKLFSKTQNKVYDISNAPADVVYDSILGIVQIRNSKGELVKNTTTVGFTEFREGFTQGKNGGELTFKAHGLSLDGTLRGQSQPGQYQRNFGQVPLGGALQVLDFNLGNAEGELLHDVAFSNLGSQVNISFGEPVAADRPLTMPIDFLGDGGFNRVSFRRTGKITVPEGINLFVAPGSAVLSGSTDSAVARNVITLQGREVAINGKISAPAGDIILSTGALAQGLKNAGNVFLLQGDISIGKNAELSTRGLWLNDRVVALNNQSPTGAALINAGSVTLNSGRAISIGGDPALDGTTTLIDVSGGGWVDTKGNLKGGNGGNLTLAGLGSLSFNSGVLGFAPNQGGTFTLTAPNLKIADGLIGRDARGNPAWLGSSNNAENIVTLSREFFQAFGFTRYSLRTFDQTATASGLSIDPGTQISLLAPYIQVGSNYRIQPTGADIYSFSNLGNLIEVRKPTSLQVSTGRVGDITVGTNAAITTDPQASISLVSNNSLYVDGTLSSPAGRISLSLGPDSLNQVFNASQVLWLGENARLISRGAVREELGSALKKGQVLQAGEISLTATLGYVIAEPGSMMDVSGANGEFDVLAANGREYQRRNFGGDAGTVSVTAAEGIFLNGRLQATKGGGDGAFGGSLAITLDPSARRDDNPDLGFLIGERQIVVRSGNPGVLPPNFQFGDAIPDEFNGTANVYAGQIEQAGFDSLKFSSAFNTYTTSTNPLAVMGGAIVIEPGVSLKVARSIDLDSPLVRAGLGSSLNAGYVAIGSAAPNAQAFSSDFAPSNGDGTLRVSAKYMDLIGTSIIQNTGLVELISEGDIRVRGVVPAANNSVTGNKEPVGKFQLAGDLVLDARQVYPSTLSHFEISAGDGSISTFQRGAAGPILSASGDLTLTATKIDHKGTIAAPLGQIILKSTGVDGSIVLHSGSVLSVSADGKTIPFGKTENGRDWVYDLNESAVSRFDSPREKSIVLNGEQIDAKPGSTIDLRGGGDLYAYEWVPGPGGSRDFLSNLKDGKESGYYAILPSLGSSYATYDTHYYQGSNLRPGDSVYLSGVAGLAAGEYALLPARYALLPGAYLIKAETKFQDLSAGSTLQLRDGTPVSSGYFTRADMGDIGRRTIGFSVMGKDAIRSRAEYRDSFANVFFADRAIAKESFIPRLPLDAGRVAFVAGSALSLGGSLLATAPSKGRGAEVDIAATSIAINDTSTGATEPGLVTLSTADLTRLGAESLLVGGVRRSTDKGTDVQVIANRIEIANSSSTSLSSSELILAANDQLTLKRGSLVEAKGARPVRSNDLIMSFAGRDSDGDGINDVAGGAVIRASAGDNVKITRNGAIDRTIGTIDLETGATIGTTRSLALDATSNTLVQGDLALPDNAQLSLSARRVTFGGGSGDIDGLLIRDDQLTQFEKLASLIVRSYTTVDFRGDVNFGSVDDQGKARLADFTLDAPTIRGFGDGAQQVTVQSGIFSLINSTGEAVADSGDGTGKLSVLSDRVLIGGGKKSISGFSQVLFSTQGEIAAFDAGKLDVQNNLTLSGSRVTAQKLSDQFISSTGSLVVTRPANPIAPASAIEPGGKLALSGKDILHQGEIVLPGGVLSLAATGPDGDVVIEPGAITDVAGVEVLFDGKAIYVDGGKINITAKFGDIKILGGSTPAMTNRQVTVSGSERGGDAGRLSLVAAGGVSIRGVISGSAAAGFKSGEFSVDAGNINDDLAQSTNVFSNLNDRLNAGGFNLSRNIRLRQGDVVIQRSDTVSANEIQIIADAGKIDVAGSLQALAPRGGRIQLWARDDLNLLESGKLIAGGGEANGRSGKIVLSSSAGQIDLRKDGEVSFNPGGAATGELTLRAARNADGNDLSIRTIRSTINGVKDIIVEGVKVYSATTVGGSGFTEVGGNLNLAVNGAGDDVLFRETKIFGEAADAVATRIFSAKDPRVQVRPGIEVRSEGDLRLSSSWNLRETYSVPEVDAAGNPIFDEGGNPVTKLVDAWRYNGVPINLSLLAKGNLELGDPNFNPGVLVNPFVILNDGFDGVEVTAASAFVSGPSASYRLAAGADFTSAKPSSLDLNVAGDVVLGRHRVMRTGDGDIDIAASRDLTIMSVAKPGLSGTYSDATSTIYTAGRPTKSDDFPQLKNNFPAPSNTTRAASYPTDGGDIFVNVGGAINGAKTQQVATKWLGRNGRTESDGTIRQVGNEALNTTWWIDFSGFEQNIGALGGGDITIRANGAIDNLSVVIPTTGRLGGKPTEKIDPNSLVVLGGGDLTIDAAGDLMSGLFYVGRGRADIKVDGSVVSGRTAADTNPNGVANPIHTLLASGEAAILLDALGSVNIESVFNPTVVGQDDSVSAGRRTFFFTYGEASNISLSSVGGNLKIFNNYGTLSDAIRTPRSGSKDAVSFGTYPSQVQFSAIQGDVELSNDFSLFPSPKGGLEIFAANAVRSGVSRINLSDANRSILVNPVYVPGGTFDDSLAALDPASVTAHGPTPVYLSKGIVNEDPVRIVANTGSISGGQFYFAKSARFVAGTDIQDVKVTGQNLRETDTTSIKAGRDIFFSTPINPNTGLPQSNNSGFEIAGPGNLIVQSGRNIDLGSSSGVVTIANRLNPALSLQGANITLVAGVADSPSYAAFIAKYLDPENANKPQTYLRDKRWADFARQELQITALSDAAAFEQYAQKQGQETSRLMIAYVKKIKPSVGKVNAEQAWGEFKQMSVDLQRPLVEQVFYGELKLAGRAQAKVGKPAYDRGFEAISTLLPGENYKGDLSLLFSQIKTESGGDIHLFVPGGKVNAGQTSQGSNSELNKDDGQLGIVAQDFGAVRAFTRGNFEVNESRVFTLRGGDILLWSSKGDIDAGRGAKTALSAPAPVLITTPTGQTIFRVLAVRGSGIRGILTDPDVKPGDVDLIAPEGFVNAGDAGIGSAGNITIAAVGVRGPGNIDIGGKATGVPTVDTGGLNAGVAGAGNSSQDATKSTDEMTKKIAESTQLSDSLKQAFKPTFITVEVIGLGEEEDEEEKKKKGTSNKTETKSGDN